MNKESGGAAMMNTRRPDRGSKLAGWLCLAATPCFALMALISATAGGADPICSAVRGGWPMSDMTAMYLAMSAFHLPPWLRLRWRGDPQAMREG